jgi:hypothetical protein
MKYLAFLLITLIELSASKARRGVQNYKAELFKKHLELREEPECALNCPISWIGDGLCDFACFVEECQYDLRDCDSGGYEGEEECSPGCPDSWVGNGFCDDKCNVADCYFDLDDCLEDPECASGCDIKSIGNGLCDEACNVEECLYDLRDCI